MSSISEKLNPIASKFSLTTLLKQTDYREIIYSHNLPKSAS